MPVALVLVGAPGSGKSTVGALLATALGAAFRDTDQDIAAAAGMDIHDIFVTQGESRFRDLERAAVIAALADHQGVLSVGGGAVLSAEVRAGLLGLPVVWLQVDAPTAVSRVGISGPRPVLLGNVRSRWADLLQARAPLYAQVARWRVETTDRAPEEVRDDILQRMRADHE
jgi:shikimate kinase